MNSWTKQSPECPDTESWSVRGWQQFRAGSACHILGRARQISCLISRSTKPGFPSQGSAPRAAAEFSSLRQGLIQLPLKSIKASHWLKQWWDQGHTDVYWKPDTRSDYFSTVTHQIGIYSIIYRLANKQEILITQSYRLHLHPWLAWWELREGFEYVLHRAAVHRTCRMQ